MPDNNEDTPVKAFVTSLGKYNEGTLIGEWVPFPTTQERMRDVLGRIGIGGVRYESTSSPITISRSMGSTTHSVNIKTWAN